MAQVGQCPTSYTDGVNLGHFVCYGTEVWYRSEWYAEVVHVETRHDHTDALVCQLVADLRKALVEKLSFVYSYHVEILGEF